MIFDERPSPARVSAAAAAKLPRAVLLALIVAYIVSGLFGRDPWPEDDATGFGIMRTMASSGDWLLPAVGAESIYADGPLAYWAGAASITVFGGTLGTLAAARLATALWFFVATGALWYATLRLARRDEAQPVAFAFGGEATSRDYARMLADVAVLLLLATVGPIVTLHETSSEPAAFALGCVVIYGLVLSLERAYAGAALCGAALGLLVLTRGAQPALWMTLACMLVVARAAPPPAPLRASALLLLAAATVAGTWAVAVTARYGDRGATYLADWATASLDNFAWPTTESLAWLMRNLAWHTFPLWPLAVWALYAWRQGLRRPHIALGLLLLATLALGLLTTRSPSGDDLLHVIAPLVLLAAFGAVTLRRAAENVIDWFAITAYCLFAAAFWAYFVALHTGLPPKMNTSMLRLTAGYVPPFEWGRVLIAAAAAGFWLALVTWRVRQPSGALWRGPALAAAGLVMLWVTFSQLFLSAVDYRRSFANLARSVAGNMSQAGGVNDCLLAHHLRPSHRAVFAFHGGVRFAASDERHCKFALHRDMSASLLDDGPPPGQWTEIWQDHRPGLPHETFRLYRRTDD